MARITDFEPLTTRVQPHRTETLCRWGSLKDGARTTLVQLNTYGSRSREQPETVSQTIQLDRGAAEFLVSLLRREFDL